MIKDLTSFGFYKNDKSSNEVPYYAYQTQGITRRPKRINGDDYHYKKVADGSANKDNVENVIQDIHHNKMQYWKKTFGSVKNYLNINQETELVRESVAQHKYAKFMNNSYEYYSKKTIKSTKGFRVDEFLSPLKAKVRDNLVLVNNAEREVVVSFRGTMNMNDWVLNAKLGINKFRTTQRYKNAEKLVQDTFEKYPDYKVVLTGHSAGAYISMDLGQRYDLTSYNYDPAISFQQIAEQSKYINNSTYTHIYRPVAGDVVSINSWASPIRNNPKIITEQLGTLPETKTIIDHHSSDLFNPEPESYHSSGDYLVRRNTSKTTLKKFLGRATEVAGYGMLGYDVVQDARSNQSREGKTFDVGRDVSSFVAGGVAGEVVAGTLVALSAPEVLVIAGAVATGVAVGVGIQYASDTIKPEVMNDVKESVNRRNEGLGMGQVERQKGGIAKDIRDSFSWIPKFNL